MLDGMTPAGFVGLCEHVLRLCAVNETETVAVLSQGDERQDYADAFMTAARQLGAATFHVRLPDPLPSVGPPGGDGFGVTPLAGNRVGIDSLKGADLVIDLLFLLFSKEQLEIQESGTRILLCVEPVAHLARMLPTPDQRRRVEVSAELLSRAKSLRFTNPAGTDVVYDLGHYPVLTEYGYTDLPGRWDHWPSGFLATGASDVGVNGRVVLDRGDILTPPFGRYVDEPVEITISDGYIDEIRGGVDADLFRDYINSFNDDRGRAISHIGWGCNENARWSGLAHDGRGIGMESRAFYGNVLFSTGPNQELGGPNDTPCHLDIPMRNCSVYLDDEPVLLHGEFVVPELQVRQKRVLNR
ncbi:leucyl aminopeptidase [Pseudonocardia sp. H11422]|uniref:leucyl aminopeptidase n=1 Tax=Pseudonocardia sp. H11422 TaxID=2835866 RepID=UPI0027E394CA|nr:leucyl aminopeptidase [Pseudonocardia sp. H11422]